MSQEMKLVTIENKEPVVSTEVLAKGFEVEHRAIMALVKKYLSEFEESEKVSFGVRPSDKNQSLKFALLTEEQAAFLGTLLRNSPRAIQFKRKLTREFFRIRRELTRLATQTQNAEWLEKRNSGKLTRRAETDTIKRFIEYAVAQGSQSAEKYYMIISKMQNQALFLLDQKFPNIRNLLNLTQLSTIEDADFIVSRALNEGTEKQMHYKEIYQLAKSRVELFAELRGKSVVPGFIEGPKTKPLELSA